MPGPNEVKVSVCVVTYNQEKYIAECLQSLVDQEVDFPFEVIVSDDCSKDGTRSIVAGFAERYPDVIKPFLHEKNMGPYENYWFAHRQASGEYIAHMDGDDYALPGKLQSQADFLDGRPECNIVWHPVIKIDARGNFVSPLREHSEAVYGKKFYREDVIRFGAIGVNSSKMYRSSIREVPMPDFKVIDYFINVEQVGDGYAAFSSSKPLGVYRQGVGIASSGTLTRSLLIKSISYFLDKYPEAKEAVSCISLTLLLGDLRRRRDTLSSSFNLFIRSFSLSTVFGYLNYFRFVKKL
ncbi:glycosyltransferase family 2 protein [Cycloclasticus pugetii]|uniref:glycosyltransferase family 2 protein n=1 Tax=Cycloclasticus pugetii TaxID=34068 RepID=UPI003A93B785